MRKFKLWGIVAVLAALPSLSARAATLVDGHGRVELTNGAGVLPGEPIGSGKLSVGDGAAATVGVDEGLKVDLAESSSASFGGDKAPVTLLQGKLTGHAAGKALTVAVADDTRITSSSGDFEVSLKGGTVHVAARQGPVDVERGGKKSTIAAGTEQDLGATVAEAVAAPAPAPAPAPTPTPAPPPPAPVPAAPAAPPSLQVAWPTAPVEKASLKLTGSTAPHAKVTVNDVSAKVDGLGNWRANVTLPEGESTVSVKVTAADGQTAAAEQKVTYTAPPPAPTPEPAPAATPEPAPSASATTPAAGSGETAAPKKKTSKPKVKQEAAGWE